MDDLITFLRARLAEDEQIARACLEEVGGTRKGEMYHDGSGTADRDDYPSYPWGSGEAELAFMARYQPARVLRDVEAKGRTIDQHGCVESPEGWACRRCSDMSSNQGRARWSQFVLAPCPTVRLLASPYDSHPDYRKDWRP